MEFTKIMTNSIHRNKGQGIKYPACLNINMPVVFPKMNKNTTHTMEFPMYPFWCYPPHELVIFSSLLTVVMHVFHM
jgi:hypothetical protein